MADDLGYGDLSFNGSKQIQTPNIDRIAAESVRFTDAYVSAPVCAPSRAGFITGRYQQRFGVQYNQGETLPGYDPDYNGLTVGERTLPSRLQERGYRTGLIGKWHLGDKPQFHPTKRGFDEFWGMINGSHDYFKSEGLESNFTKIKDFGYITDEIGSQGQAFLKRNKEKTFFLMMSFNAPHAPMQATVADLELYKHIPQLKRRTYCAMVHRLDVNFGRLMESLRQEGLDKNTVVVFLSDNGGPAQDNASVNAPLDGKKGTTMEGGIRVPMLIRWPDKIKPRTSKQVVISLDLTPTFLNLAGAKPLKRGETDGIDLMPFLTNPQKSEDRTLFWLLGPMAAIRTGKMKMLLAQDRLPFLFDLNADISEQRNLFSTNQRTTAKMIKELSDWKNSCPQPAFVNDIIWHKRQLDMLDETFPLVQPERTDKIVWGESKGIRTREN